MSNCSESQNQFKIRLKGQALKNAKSIIEVHKVLEYELLSAFDKLGGTVENMTEVIQNFSRKNLKVKPLWIY
jgi:hypothetical protein